MDPDPHYAHHVALRTYVEAVARRLGVEPAATWTDYGPPSAAYIALANRPAEYPGRFLMLQWTSERGWALAIEPEAAERPVELAAWPDTVRPDPGDLVAAVRRTLTPGTRPAPAARPSPDPAQAITGAPAVSAPATSREVAVTQTGVVSAGRLCGGAVPGMSGKAPPDAAG